MAVTKQLYVGVLYTLAMLGSLASAQTLVPQLDYGTFQGAYNAKYNLSYWQKIPFAAPPVGQNRFRGPQPPDRITNVTIYNSTQTYGECPQRGNLGTEDCLFLVRLSKSIVCRGFL